MTVNYCLRRASSFFGRNLAIDHEDRQITYQEFYRLVEDSARKLTALGAKKGERVALLMLNSPEYLELYYSTAMAGAVIVPLNTRWHINEITYTLSDSGSKILFVDERFAPLAPQLRKALPGLEHIVLCRRWSLSR
jgi:acyl-CoA synthetase (AMP-forming)/AMP-acid ligase II